MNKAMCLKRIVYQEYGGYGVKTFRNPQVSEKLIMPKLIILILLRIIPYNIVWGGQIDDSSSLTALEGTSLFLTIVFLHC